MVMQSTTGFPSLLTSDPVRPGISGSEHKRRLLKAYGSQSSSYFIFQDGVEYFEGSSGGFVPYSPQKTPFGAVNIVFTNPICSDVNLRDLLDEYLLSQTEPSVFVSVDKKVADTLRLLGFRVNNIGNESSFNIHSFDTYGKQKKQLRHAANFGKRSGCTVKEQAWSDVDTWEVERLSRAWLDTKGVNHRELRLATRPPVYSDEWEVRKFFCYDGDRMVGYVFFDPYFEAGELKGYCANILRSTPEKGYGCVLDFIILQAIEKFRLEGVPELSLGVAPMSNTQPLQGDSKAVRWVSRAFYEYGNHLYAFKGLSYHKSRYRPRITPWYICTRDTGVLKTFWALCFGLKVLGRRDF